MIQQRGPRIPMRPAMPLSLDHREKPPYLASVSCPVLFTQYSQVVNELLNLLLAESIFERGHIWAEF